MLVRGGALVVAAVAATTCGGGKAKEQPKQSPASQAVKSGPDSPGPTVRRAPPPPRDPMPPPPPPLSVEDDQAAARAATPAVATTPAPGNDDLGAQISRPDRVKTRREQYARAVELISAQLGAPISAADALRANPCGGWTGPECSNLTIGLEIAKMAAPIVARWHKKSPADVAAVLVEAVSIHSVWHDAYGYVRQALHKGPGYTYAGCLFSRCNPDSVYAGQIDGILYQVGRLLKVVDGPACGPDCTLADP